MSSPHILVLPGGGYELLSDAEGEPVARWLRSIGCSAEVVRYPVRTRHPGPLERVRGAVHTARESGHHKVGVLGFSAGGHAAGMAAFAPGARPDTRVDFAILCAAVVSMRLPTHAGSRKNLVGWDADDELRRATSLDALVSPAAPPTFVWHTANDDVVPVEHAYLLGSALARAGVPHALHVYERGPHGLGHAGGLGGAEAWTRDCAEWLERLPDR